jgi:hypothetical protein
MNYALLSDGSVLVFKAVEDHGRIEVLDVVFNWRGHLAQLVGAPAR